MPSPFGVSQRLLQLARSSQSRRSVENRRLDAAISGRSTTTHGVGPARSNRAEELSDMGIKSAKSDGARGSRASPLDRPAQVSSDDRLRNTPHLSRGQPLAWQLAQRAEPGVGCRISPTVRPRGGWQYLTVFLDLFSRMVVGWALSSSLSAEMVLAAFSRGIRSATAGAGLIIHSDNHIRTLRARIFVRCSINVDSPKT